MLSIFAWLSLVSVIPLFITVLNVLTWTRPKPSPWKKRHCPSVSVLIPARNEADCIAKSVQSVCTQQYGHFDVFVYDDQSTDRTPEILHSLQQDYDNLHVITGGALPKHWKGKNHACHQLAMNSKGDILIYLDADTVLAPYAIDTIVQTMTNPFTASDLLSGLPKQHQYSPIEKFFLPLLHLTFLSWLPLELVRYSPFPSMTAAIGQLMAVKRFAYLKYDGFNAIPQEIVDDMALAQHFKRHRASVRFIDAHHLASCRMYQNIHDIWQGFSKNIFVGIGGWLPFFGVGLLYVTSFILPFGMIFAVPWLNAAQTSMVLIGISANIIMRIGIAIRYEQSMRYSLTQPFAIVLLACIALNSAYQSTFGTIAWKGRTYQDV